MNRREAEELLPWFMAGTLDAEEMQAVKAFIDSGEISADELAELAFLNESVAATGAEEPAYNPQLLQRAVSRLDGVAQAPASDFLDRLTNPDSGSDPDARADRPGLLASLLERLQWSLTPPLARVAIAAQFALVLGLVVALTLGERAGDGTEEPGFEVVAGEVAGDITVAFTPSATAQQIRRLLADNNASIVAGPSALGIYTLDIAEGVARDEALAALQASGVTMFVQRVPDP
jgi:hypothetical protein